jgi:hypothetical protein
MSDPKVERDEHGDLYVDGCLYVDDVDVLSLVIARAVAAIEFVEAENVEKTKATDVFAEYLKAETNMYWMSLKEWGEIAEVAQKFLQKFLKDRPF